MRTWIYCRGRRLENTSVNCRKLLINATALVRRNAMPVLNGHFTALRMVPYLQATLSDRTRDPELH